MCRAGWQAPAECCKHLWLVLGAHLRRLCSLGVTVTYMCMAGSVKDVRSPLIR